MTRPTKKLSKKPTKKLGASKKLAAPPVDDDDDEPAPAKQKAAPKKGAKSKLRGGWGASQQMMDATSDFAQNFKPTSNVQIIKFREDKPYVGYARHWVETSQGKRTFTCLDILDQDCPLCDVGVEIQAVSGFNIVIVDDDGTLTQRTWDVGPRLFKQLKGFAEDPKIGPLSRFFFGVSKTGSGGTASTNVIPIRPSTLEEEYEVIPPSDDELEAIPVYDPSIVFIHDADTLQEIAEEQE